MTYVWNRASMATKKGMQYCLMMTYQSSKKQRAYYLIISR